MTLHPSQSPTPNSRRSGPVTRRLTPALAAVLSMVTAVALAAALPTAPAAADPSIREMERKIEKLAAKLGVVIEKYNQTRDELDEIKAKADRIAKRVAPLQKRADKMYAEVGKISAVVYKGGRVGIANAMLDSGSPKILLDQLSTLDRLAAARQKGLRGLELITSRIDRKQAQIDRLLSRQREVEKDLRARKKNIQGEIDKLQKMRKKVYGDKLARNGQRPSYIPPYIPGRPGKVVRYAQAQLGDPYSFGSDGPDSFDCSGLTLAAWRTVGVSLPHSASKQYHQTRRISRSELSPGDLVFYYSDLHHNAIYIGEGWIIHAPEPGRNVEQVRYDKFPITGYGRPG